VAKHWYRLDVVEGDRSRVLVGSSELDPAQLMKQLRTGDYVVLNDLSYRDNQNRIVSWSDWDPRLTSVAYVNPQYVVMVIPFASDPRAGQSGAP